MTMSGKGRDAFGPAKPRQLGALAHANWYPNCISWGCMVQLVGWCSSVLLLLTIAIQVRKQWCEHSAKGISPWLYAGQIAASAGFAVYSGLLLNWVFLVTNTAVGIAAILGLAFTLMFARKAKTVPRSKMPARRQIASARSERVPLECAEMRPEAVKASFR